MKSTESQRYVHRLEIVGDEEVGEAVCFLKFGEQVHDLHWTETSSELTASSRSRNGELRRGRGRCRPAGAGRRSTGEDSGRETRRRALPFREARRPAPEFPLVESIESAESSFMTAFDAEPRVYEAIVLKDHAAAPAGLRPASVVEILAAHETRPLSG
jgi:hypothetical protein